MNEAGFPSQSLVFRQTPVSGQLSASLTCLIRTYPVYLYGQNIIAMDTKLTIKLDNDVISRAKRYAQHRKTSLSKMIESYLDTVTKPDSDDIEITPLVKSLSGVISLPEDYDYKKDRTDYLIKKYS